MRTLAAVLLITSLALAGCFGGGGDDDPTPTGTSTQTSTETSTETSTTQSTSSTVTATGTSGPDPNETENTAPTASLSASIQQGEVPVDVSFTLDGADADGDDLTWTFDADGDGTFEAEGTDADLPASYEHSYASEGSYNASLTVSDGTNSTSQTVAIDATAAAGGEGPVQAVSVSWQFGPSDAGAPSEFLNCEVGPFDGITHGTFQVDPASYGEPFQATLTDASEGAAVESWAIIFMQADCSDFSDVTSGDLGGAADLSGTVPAGSGLAIVISSGGAMLEATYTAG